MVLYDYHKRMTNKFLYKLNWHRSTHNKHMQFEKEVHDYLPLSVNEKTLSFPPKVDIIYNFIKISRFFV